MKKLTTFVLIAPVLLCFYSCENNTQKSAPAPTAPRTLTPPPKPEIKIYEAAEGEAFPDATLKMKLKGNPVAGKNFFEFTVSGGYSLGEATADAETKGSANANKGQHIHFILNNEPYSAVYQPNFEYDLAEGNNVILAFLARSYHESIKSPKAYVFQQFVVGEGEKTDETQAMLFYSRPKGNYATEAETDKILLDFFLLNTELSPDGYKVRVTLDGEEYILSKWAPYFIEGLEWGSHSIRIELIDKDGKLVEGPFSDSGVRIFSLTEG